MDCSIVIRAYNEGRHIGRLLEGIQQQTVRNVEIILVDSGSSDDTLAIASKYCAQIVQIKPQDFTFGRSLNLGLQAASHELVVIASAHVYPIYPDWLERLLEPFENQSVGLTYGKQRAHPCDAQAQPTAKSRACPQPNFQNTRSLRAGFRNNQTPTNPTPSATTPTPPSANPCGDSIPMTKT